MTSESLKVPSGPLLNIYIQTYISAGIEPGTCGNPIFLLGAALSSNELKRRINHEDPWDPYIYIYIYIYIYNIYIFVFVNI